MWAHGRLRPPSGSTGAEPRPHPLAGLDNSPIHRPGAYGWPYGSASCPPPDAPPTLSSRIPGCGIGAGLPLFADRQVVGGAVAGVQLPRGEACLPWGSGGCAPCQGAPLGRGQDAGGRQKRAARHCLFSTPQRGVCYFSLPCATMQVLTTFLDVNQSPLQLRLRLSSLWFNS